MHLWYIFTSAEVRPATRSGRESNGPWFYTEYYVQDICWVRLSEGANECHCWQNWYMCNVCVTCYFRCRTGDLTLWGTGVGNGNKIIPMLNALKVIVHIMWVLIGHIDRRVALVTVVMIDIEKGHTSFVRVMIDVIWFSHKNQGEDPDMKVLVLGVKEITIFHSKQQGQVAKVILAQSMSTLTLWCGEACPMLIMCSDHRRQLIHKMNE